MLWVLGDRRTDAACSATRTAAFSISMGLAGMTVTPELRGVPSIRYAVRRLIGESALADLLPGSGGVRRRDILGAGVVLGRAGNLARAVGSR